MSVPSANSLYRRLPAVDDLLQRPTLQEVFARLGPVWSREVVRDVLGSLRQLLQRSLEQSPGPGVEADLDALLDARLDAIDELVHNRAAQRLHPSLRPVLNATGVVLHTNLGRAPLATSAADQVALLARSYSNLEYDLDTGRRGKRDVHAESLACQLTGAERTIVVNNNAAAVFLLLNSLAFGGEVLVSRGELVEIGGSFRVPDIMARSGARLVEVGTTNRTRISDYRNAITPQTRLILRVHPSNFRMTGFVEQPTLEELAQLGREASILVAEDLGSGCLADLSPTGLDREPLVADSIRAGIDVVTFSGDKLLGGPQAGLISGRRAVLDQLRANPLFRALRVDRLTYAALEETLRLWCRRAWNEIPAMRMIFAGDLKQRAEAFAASLPDQLRARTVLSASVAGGGSTPGQSLATWVVVLDSRGLTPNQLEACLRRQEPPVITRIDHDQVILDLRTIFPDQEDLLRNALQEAVERGA